MPFLLKTLIMAAMQSGDSLVINFPLATMLTFTSAVAKLTIRVLGQHHSLLQVISQSYCQVFGKSYNFVFEKINITLVVPPCGQIVHNNMGAGLRAVRQTDRNNRHRTNIR